MASGLSRTSPINGWGFGRRPGEQNMGIIHLINAGSKLSGHAMVIVEMVDDHGHLFVGQYDIRAHVEVEETGVVQRSLGNYQGYISEVRTHHGPSYTRDYSSYRPNSRSWLRPVAAIEALIANVMKWKTTVERSLLPGNARILYQVAGSKRTSLLGGNSGHNCVTWVEEQLILANIENGKKLDKIKAAPQGHVMSPKARTALAIGGIVGLVGLIAGAALLTTKARR